MYLAYNNIWVYRASKDWRAVGRNSFILLSQLLNYKAPNAKPDLLTY